MRKLDAICFLLGVSITGVTVALREYMRDREYGKLLGQMALNEANRVKMYNRMDAYNEVCEEAMSSLKEDTEEDNM